MDRQPMRIPSTPMRTPRWCCARQPQRGDHIGIEWIAAIAVSSPAGAYAAMQSAECPCPKFGKYVVLRPLSACQATRQCSETGRYPNG